MWVDAARDAVAAQWHIGQRFWSDSALRPAMLAIWLASFGGALHEPVTPYFYRALGATDSQIGDYGLVRTAFGFVLTPLYGWALDHGSAYWPLVASCFFCAAGCLARGFAPEGNIAVFYASGVVLGLGAANLWTVAGSYVACVSPRESRTEVLSGFTVQVTALSLLGKSLYRPWNAAVLHGLDWLYDEGAIREEPASSPGVLLRYRIHMSVCTFFCIGGFFQLLWSYGAMSHTAPTHSEVESHLQPPAGCMGRRCVSISDADALAFGLLCAALGAVAFAQTTLLAVWPYYVQDRYGWSDTEFAHLVFASTLLSIVAVALAPSVLERRLGRAWASAALLLCAAGAAALSFPSGEPGETAGGEQAERAGHATGACVLAAALAAARPTLETMGSLCLPRRRQGLAFGLMATLAAAGQAAGNALSLRLYSRRADAAAFHLCAVFLFVGLFGVLTASLLRDHDDRRRLRAPAPEGEELLERESGAGEAGSGLAEEVCDEADPDAEGGAGVASDTAALLRRAPVPRCFAE